MECNPTTMCAPKLWKEAVVTPDPDTLVTRARMALAEAGGEVTCRKGR